MTLTKNTFREKCLDKLKKNSTQNKYYKDKLLNKKLLDELKKVKNKKILFYYPLKNEANIVKSLHILRKNNEIYLPFMEGKSFKMVPYRLPLKKKKFGIFEAGNSIRKIDKIDIAIVPVVGVDGGFQRVGFGKGMYDRFFVKLQKKPYTIFIQSTLCFTTKYICDSFDISCDVIMTPKKTVKKGNRC